MEKRYGVWSGNPKGTAEDMARCTATVGGKSLWGPADARQCQRKRGFGPEGAFCRQHGRVAEEAAEARR